MLVVIVDPHTGVRNALSLVLNDEPGVRVLAGRGLDAAAGEAGDVALVDERLAGASSSAGRSALRALSSRLPSS